MRITGLEGNHYMHILFVTANRVGDAVLSSGLLEKLTEHHPDARITVAAGPSAASLFRNAPGLERLIVLEKKRGNLHWFSLWIKCIIRRWDIVVDLRRSAIAYLLLAGKRYVVPKSLPDIHRVELIAATLKSGMDPPTPVLWPDDNVEKLPNDTPVIAIAPTANWIGKQWRSERFGELAARLIGEAGPFPGARVAVFAAAGERRQAEPLLHALPQNRLLDLVGVGDLAVVGGFLRQCEFFVGNDSGLMHMAAAANIPTIGLFGPSRTEHYAPWGNNCTFIRTPESYDDLVGTPGYDHRTTGTLMDGLSVDAVFDTCLALAEKTRRNKK